MKTLILTVCAVLIFVAVPVEAAPAVVIRDQSVTATGLTPGAGAVIFSVSHEPRIAYYTNRTVSEHVPDDDRDGEVSYMTAAPVSLRSVWVIVDAATGRYTVATPEGAYDRVAAARRSRARKNAKGELSELVHERSWLELLVVRPGGRVWALTAMRGGAADVAKSSNEFATPMTLFRPLTTGAGSLERLTHGDTVIAIDAHAVEYFILGVE